LLEYLIKLVSEAENDESESNYQLEDKRFVHGKR
jgi:hypothetical protein